MNNVIRTMRCCMCPNKADSFICYPPKGNDTPVKQCNFVLNYQDRFKAVYSVQPYVVLDNIQYYTIMYKRNKSSTWNCPIWSHIYEIRDRSQEELNTVAIAKGWQPVKIT